MGTVEEESSLTAFLRTVNVGDVLTGTVAEMTRSGTTVLLDAFAGAPVGVIGPLDLSWGSSGSSSAGVLEVGGRVSAEVIAVDLPERQVRLSRSATENPRLWAYLKSLRPGQRLSGTVAAIERFGVFVDLDDGPGHPVFPGVGFITMPELSWHRFEDPSEVVSVGGHVTCEVLVFDTYNGEARLSLRATQPDSFEQFAHRVHVGQILHGTVTKVVPFGAFIRVAAGIEGLIHLSDDLDLLFAGAPAHASHGRRDVGTVPEGLTPSDGLSRPATWLRPRDGAPDVRDSRRHATGAACRDVRAGRHHFWILPAGGTEPDESARACR